MEERNAGGCLAWEIAIKTALTVFGCTRIQLGIHGSHRSTIHGPLEWQDRRTGQHQSGRGAEGVTAPPNLELTESLETGEAVEVWMTEDNTTAKILAKTPGRIMLG